MTVLDALKSKNSATLIEILLITGLSNKQVKTELRALYKAKIIEFLKTDKGYLYEIRH